MIFHGKTWNCVQNKAEKGLGDIISWLEDSLLSLNIGKTKFLCFTKTNVDSLLREITIRTHTFPCNRLADKTACTCAPLSRSSDIKYLGVIIDDKLRWDKQVGTVASRIRKLIPIFKTLRSVTDAKSIIELYKALCECIISYCICAWGCAAKKHFLVVERAQRALLKVALFLPYRYPTADLYEKCGVFTVRQMFIYRSILRFHKSAVSHLPTTVKRINKFSIPRFNSSYGQRHYDFMGPKLYNMLNGHSDIRFNASRGVKTVLKRWLQSLDYTGTEKLLENVT